MKIVIKTKNLKLNQALKDFIEEKFNNLEKFAPPTIFGGGQTEKYFNGYFGRGKPRVEAWVEIGKTTLHHQKGPIFWAECQMKFPGKSLRAVARRENLKLAIAEVKDELQQQLKQYKEKLFSLTKKKVKILKKELRLVPQARLNFEKNLGGQARFYRKGRIKEEGL